MKQFYSKSATEAEIRTSLEAERPVHSTSQYIHNTRTASLITSYIYALQLSRSRKCSDLDEADFMPHLITGSVGVHAVVLLTQDQLVIQVARLKPS